MLITKLHKNSIHDILNEAVGILNAGGIVAYPTETFYGLGVKFDRPGSLKRLYELKKRPADKAMPVIIGNTGMLSDIVSQQWLENIPQPARSLMDRFWPGALTLLLPAKAGLSEFLTAGTGLIAVRIPAGSFALDLARKAGFPITATSANISGMAPAVNAREVAGYFHNKIDLLVDGGDTPGGLPSTIVEAEGLQVSIMREGAIGKKEIINCLPR